jgi:hypothetical protein
MVRARDAVDHRRTFKHYEMTSIYKVIMKMTYQFNEHLNKGNAKQVEFIKELEMKLEETSVKGVMSPHSN